METLGSNVRAVGLAQRRLLWAILASIVGWLLLPLLVLAIPYQLYAVFKLSKVLNLTTFTLVMYFISIFLPVVSLICLVRLNSNATVILQLNGIRVGLMGPKVSDLPLV